MDENNPSNNPENRPEIGPTPSPDSSRNNPSPSTGHDKIVHKVIEEEMAEAYVNYAMSVIVGRALPDVRDGLKPVHRRILYAMFDMGILSSKSFKKCARIVGEVLGKYHPHGDTAVYDSLVRMAQDFSLRYPLIKGQGNFGSIDGDSAAAMRYTEAKLSKLAEEMLKDIEKETVSFKDNFDGSLKEPEVLPTTFPNLLVNGSSGIAVGMATSIPPHNLQEVCDGAIAVIDNPEIDPVRLMSYIPAPDFPTGGEIICGGALRYAYEKGRGKVTIKSVVSFEKGKIVVKEIPYMVNKAEMIEQIAELVKDKKILGIRNINDESDREGIRIVIDLKNDAEPQVVLNQLYQFSRMKISFGLTLLSLVNKQPKLLGLKEMIEYHIEHRKDVIIKRTTYDLDQAEKKVHVLEGLLVALDNVDPIIAGIKRSKTVEEAKEFLMHSYRLTEIQAKAILDLKLQKLASLEQEKIRLEHKEFLEKIIYYHSILESKEKVLGLIKEELMFIKENYGDARRSKITISEEEDSDLNMEDLIEDESVVVTMTTSGYIKRQPLDVYKTQRRGGKGVKAAATKEEDIIDSLYIASTHNYLLCFTNEGQLYWVKVWQIPESSRLAKGKHIANVLEMKPGERITAIVPVKDFKEGYLFMVTKNGTVKKTELMEFSNPRNGGIRAINLDEGDDLIKVRYTDGNQEIIIATKNGLANRFNEVDVRPMGRASRGVRGIRLTSGDEVIGMLAAEEDKNILTITTKGYGKQTPVRDYRLCNRGGKGVTNIKITEKNGPVKAIMLVDGTEELMLVSTNGVGIRIRCSDVSVIGRATQGVRVMRLAEGDQLAAAAKIEMKIELGELTTNPKLTDSLPFSNPASLSSLSDEIPDYKNNKDIDETTEDNEDDKDDEDNQDDEDDNDMGDSDNGDSKLNNDLNLTNDQDKETEENTKENTGDIGNSIDTKNIERLNGLDNDNGNNKTNFSTDDQENSS